MDVFEADGILDIARTDGFKVLIRELEELASRLDESVLVAARSGDLPAVRYASGRANGVHLVVDRLRNTLSRARQAS